MGNKYDWKKIMQMVAVIGILCLFVGIATRLLQKSQTSLSDYAKKNPETAYAVSPKDNKDKADAGSDYDKTDAGRTSDKTDAGRTEDKNDTGKKTEDTGSAVAGEDHSITAQEIYDNFYYTEEEQGYKFHIMYYDSSHNVSTAEVIMECDDPDEMLSLYYDLFKGEHEFEDISRIQSIKITEPQDP